MKIISCKLENFASYKNLEFNFDNQGLALIHGATGSGKSTLCDAIPWVLFGKTAKGGAVDEIISWQGGAAEGTISVLVNDKLTVQIRRSRKPNDLWVNAYDHNIFKGFPESIPTRGKDLNDTQKIINNLLGIDCDLYLSGAYFHEFSQTAQFFTTTAKNRRAICEQLVDLTLPKKLQDSVSVNFKSVKEELALWSNKLYKQQVQINSLSEQYKREVEIETTWQQTLKKREASLLKQADDLEASRIKTITKLKLEAYSLDVSNDDKYETAIKDLNSKLPSEKIHCKECGQSVINKEHKIILDDINSLKITRLDNSYKLREFNSKRQQIKNHEQEVNVYLQQLEALADEVNPYDSNATMIKLNTETSKLADFEKTVVDLETKQTDLDILGDVAADFRGILIKNTILDIESKTNILLSNHFDAEIKIELSVEDADKLEVIILKDGNTCTYTQLSKGQRQLLKLCFGVSVMKCVANHHGIKFNQVFFDEAFDGLDETFKIKAYGLLQTLALEYDSVFVVEHSSELKERFEKKFKVELIGGASEIYEET